MRRNYWRNLTSARVNPEIPLGAIWLLFLWKCIVKFFLDKKIDLIINESETISSTPLNLRRFP